MTILKEWNDFSERFEKILNRMEASVDEYREWLESKKRDEESGENVPYCPNCECSGCLEKGSWRTEADSF